MKPRVLNLPRPISPAERRAGAPRASAPRRFWAARALAGLVGLGAGIWGCGGSGTPEPRAADSAERDTRERATDDAENDAEEAEGAAQPAPADPCADGTCFSCGKSLCLTGWYCDDAAKGGAACSWLPECATSPSCRCLTKVLGAGCSCKDEGGAPHVSCD